MTRNGIPHGAIIKATATRNVGPAWEGQTSIKIAAPKKYVAPRRERTNSPPPTTAGAASPPFQGTLQQRQLPSRRSCRMPPAVPTKAARLRGPGCNTLGEAVDLARHGWPEGWQRMKALRDAIFARMASQVHRDVIQFRIAGGAVNVARFLSGRPDCFMARVKSSHVKGLRSRKCCG